MTSPMTRGRGIIDTVQTILSELIRALRLSMGHGSFREDFFKLSFWHSRMVTFIHSHRLATAESGSCMLEVPGVRRFRPRVFEIRELVGWELRVDSDHASRTYFVDGQIYRRYGTDRCEYRHRSWHSKSLLDIDRENTLSLIIMIVVSTRTSRHFPSLLSTTDIYLIHFATFLQQMTQKKDLTIRQLSRIDQSFGEILLLVAEHDV